MIDYFVFQYQQKFEPIQFDFALPETVTIDKWFFQYPEPVLRELTVIPLTMSFQIPAEEPPAPGGNIFKMCLMGVQ